MTRILTTIAICASYFTINAITINDIASDISNVNRYKASAEVRVSMPQFDDEVTYKLLLWQQVSPSDTILPVKYIVDWQQKDKHGFSAYLSGTHYRCNEGRLKVYNIKTESISFSPMFGKSVGVHRSGQFVNFLPIEVATELQEIVSDSRYNTNVHPDTMVNGDDAIVIELTMMNDGEMVRRMEYVIDKQSRLPIAIYKTNNCGSGSEQRVSVSYQIMESDENNIGEALLKKLYPKIFNTYNN